MPNDYRLTFLISSREVTGQLDISNKFGRFLQEIRPTIFGILPLNNKEKHREKPVID